MNVLKLSDLHIRQEKTRTVVDVSGGEQYIQGLVDQALSCKEATKLWDGNKGMVRSIGREAVALMETTGVSVDAAILLSGHDRGLEVTMLSRRKNLHPDVVSLMTTLGRSDLFEESVEVTLSGPLAAWALTVLGNRAGDPNVSVKKETVLVKNFEVRRREGRNNPAEIQLWDDLTAAGLVAPAVEAKLIKG